MTKINFFRLADDAGSLHKLLASLISSTLDNGLDILVHTDGQEQAAGIYRTVEQALGLGHLIAAEVLPRAVVSISWGTQPAHHHGMLINLRAQAPVWFSRFQHFVELVRGEGHFVACKRANYRLFHHRGYSVNYQDLTELSHHDRYTQPLLT